MKKEKDDRKLNRNRTCTTLIDLVMHQYRRTTDNGFFSKKRSKKRSKELKNEDVVDLVCFLSDQMKFVFVHVPVYQHHKNRWIKHV